MIELAVLGATTQARCVIPRADGREATFSVLGTSGAQALGSLMRTLSKSFAGEAWVVAGEPELHGVVPNPKPHRRARRRTRRGSARTMAVVSVGNELGLTVIGPEGKH